MSLLVAKHWPSFWLWLDFLPLSISFVFPSSLSLSLSSLIPFFFTVALSFLLKIFSSSFWWQRSPEKRCLEKADSGGTSPVEDEQMCGCHDAGLHSARLQPRCCSVFIPVIRCSVNYHEQLKAFTTKRLVKTNKKNNEVRKNRNTYKQK